MTDEPRNRFSGTPLSVWIEQIPNELPADAVGLWQIAGPARHDFGLDGEALVSCVRRAVQALLARGARPVVGGGDTGFYWLPQLQYGSEPDEMADAVLREWQARGMPDEDQGGLWFALPEDCEARWK